MDRFKYFLPCPVEEKMKRHKFRSLEEFREQFQIIHQNCMTKELTIFLFIFTLICEFDVGNIFQW